MKKELNFILIFLFLISTTLGASEKRYSRAMLMTGAGMDIASFIGMYDAYDEEGMTPDLLIGSCGGSIAVAIIKAIPDKKQRLEFLVRKEFHDYLKTVKMNGPLVQTAFYAAINAFKVSLSNTFNYTPRANLHGYTLIKSSYDDNPPEIFEDIEIREHNLLDKKIVQDEEGPAVIFMAGKMSYTRNDRDKMFNDGKLFKEAYFTDDETAGLLEGRKSRIGKEYSNSYVSEDTVIVRGKTLWDGVRASISDPNLVEPAEINGVNYFSGVINLNPFEMASELADEVVAKYPSPFTIVEEHAVKVSLGYDGKVDRKKFVSTTDKVNRWIDMTNDGVSSMLGPKPGMKLPLIPGLLFDILGPNKSEIELSSPSDMILNVIFNDFGPLSLIDLKTKVPKSMFEFHKKIWDLYQSGYDKAIESINEAEGSKKHIDEPFHDGSNN